VRQAVSAVHYRHKAVAKLRARDKLCVQRHTRTAARRPRGFANAHLRRQGRVDHRGVRGHRARAGTSARPGRGASGA